MINRKHSAFMIMAGGITVHLAPIMVSLDGANSAEMVITWSCDIHIHYMGCIITERASILGVTTKSTYERQMRQIDPVLMNTIGTGMTIRILLAFACMT